LEQIQYNRLDRLPPEARVAKSSKLTAPICNAALRGEFPRGLRIGTFPRRQTGGWVIAATGLFDIIGAPGVGWLHKQDSEALHPVGALFLAGDLDRGLHLVPITSFPAIMFGVATGPIFRRRRRLRR